MAVSQNGLRRIANALVRDESGNALMIMAVAIIPLLGMAGGALDMSRLYLAKSRLQQACDAAALGSRKSMSGSTWTSDNQTVGENYFHTNFSTGLYGSTGSSIILTSDNQIVHGTARVTVPMTIMSMFGVTQRTLNASCDAELRLPNSDVMFVLDTTGSMSDTNPGDSTSKIVGLRSAVMNFYNTLENSRGSTTQVRYGFVPYSTTVNVGMLLRREWMADSWHYQSREFDHTDQVSNGNQGATNTTYSAWQQLSGTRGTYTSTGDPENCVAPANTMTNTTTYSPYNSTTNPKSRTATQTINGSTYSASVSSNGVCTITETRYDNYTQQRTETVSDNPNAGQPNSPTTRVWYNYHSVTYPLTSLKGSNSNGLMAGGTISAPLTYSATSSPPGPVYTSVPWNSTNACIEERDTVPDGGSGTAYDLMVDLVPNPMQPATQWRPALPKLVYARSVTNYTTNPISGWSYDPVVTMATNYINLGNYTNDHAACPSPARKLMSQPGGLTASVLQNYLNALVPKGTTYHDIGFLWGLRLISAQGLFASENTTAPNGGTIARHIIFMTDGETDTHIEDYDAYGLAALDRRRTSQSSLPTNSQQNTIVENRLANLCTLAKNDKNITVWVIAYGTDLTSLLSNCATPNHAYRANNSVQLNATFASIASQISQLRLTH